MEIAVRRGDPADVDPDRSTTADAFEAPVLEDAEKSRLEVRFQFADLVEKEGAAVGQFDSTAPAFDGARKRALLVAGQLAFEDTLGQRAGRDFLPGPAFSLQQNGRRSACDFPERGLDWFHHLGAERELDACGLLLTRGCLSSVEEGASFEGAFHDEAKLGRAAGGFLQILVGAQFHRLDRAVDGAVRGAHDDFDLGPW